MQHKVFISYHHKDDYEVCNFVTKYSNSYENTFIKRIAYTCKSECVFFESEKEEWEQKLSLFFKKQFHFSLSLLNLLF